jgi:tetratricopeptide (TPR) repeat protein
MNSRTSRSCAVMLAAFVTFGLSTSVFAQTVGTRTIPAPPQRIVSAGISTPPGTSATSNTNPICDPATKAAAAAALPASATPPKADHEGSDINSIARYAIEASREATDTVKWEFAAGAGLLAVLVAVLSLMGVQSLNHAVVAVSKVANARLDEALKGIQDKADKQLLSTDARLLENLESCNLVCVRSLETVRLALQAENWDETSQGQLASFREALQSARDVQERAKQVKGLERSYTWAAGMEGYISDKLGNYGDAIAAQLRAMKLAPPERLRTEYHFQYNLACYYVKAGRLDEAVEPLRQAMTVGGEDARVAAWKDEELKALRESKEHADRLQPLLGTAPPP